MRIAIDMMSGDLGPKALFEAVIKFKKENKDFDLFLFGKASDLQEIKDYGTIVDCSDVVTMNDSPLKVVRNQLSSMYKAVDYTANGLADLVISAGSTGSFLMLAVLKIKTIEGIDKPALLSPFPTANGKDYVTVLDIGANNEVSSTNLVQFAKLGTIFATHIFKINNPSVALLSNGSESHKGTQNIQQAYKELEASNLKFVGNIEGREALFNHCDVLVTGGFDGNIFLKTLEGSMVLIKGKLKKIFKRNIFTKIGYLLTKSSLNREMKALDYKKVGGAIMIGLNAPVIKAHGNSDSTSFYASLLLAKRMLESKMIEEIKAKLEKTELQ